MNQHPAFGSRQLGALFASAPMTCIDVGSRGGPKPDLEPIAFAVDWVGFEPDEGECARLNRLPARPWRSMRHLPIGLAGAQGQRKLLVTRMRGASSALPPDLTVARRFSRGDYYEISSTTPSA